MMNQDFEQVVKNTFEHFEADVNPQVWANIQQGLHGTPPAGQSGPAGSGASGMKAAAVLSKTAAVITSSVVVVATGVTIWYFAGTNNEKQPASPESTVISNTTPIDAVPSSEPASGATTGKQENPSTLTNTSPLKSEPVNKTETVSDNTNAPATASPQNTDERPVVEQQPAADISSKPVMNPTPKVETSPNSADAKPSKPEKAEVDDLIQKFNDEPLAFISANPVSGNAPLVVNFANTGYASRVKWDFGDGTAYDNSSQTSHTFNTPGKYTIRLTATDKENKEFSDEMVVIVKDEESAVHSSISEIPNVFTPNGDAYNDVFRIESSNLASLKVMIFDASGKMIYQWTNPDGGWDGRTAKGKMAEDASYFYIIEATGKDGKVYKPKGTVRLIR